MPFSYPLFLENLPRNFLDFRPISLLNFVYKIISKILASRLSLILPLLISTHQAAFVKGRSIHHHAALAHELIQKLNSKTRGGSVCLMLDISKAFDKLQWNFLFRALKFFNFSSAWINMVRELICSTKGSVLINGNPCGFFSSFCGLRQGDPPFPYLFILVEEILSLKLEVLRKAGIIEPISSIPATPCHLLYADDIMLFIKACKHSLRSVNDLLAKYQASFGQCFNLHNSQLFTGRCPARSAFGFKASSHPSGSSPVYLPRSSNFPGNFQTLSFQSDPGLFQVQIGMLEIQMPILCWQTYSGN